LTSTGVPLEVKVTIIGETTIPVFAEKLTEFGRVAAVGVTKNPLPPPDTLVVNVPVPIKETLVELPQDIVNPVGDTLNGIVVTASPLAPWTPSTVEVSTVLPVASVTINDVFPQPKIWAVKLPPFALTMPGAAIEAKPGNGDTTE
jgi:hypothetical protein